MSWCCISWKISKEINQNDNIFISVESACLYSSPDAWWWQDGGTRQEVISPIHHPGLLRCPRVPTTIIRGEYCDQTPSQPSLSCEAWLIWHETGLMVSPGQPGQLIWQHGQLTVRWRRMGWCPRPRPRQENIRPTTKQNCFSRDMKYLLTILKCGSSHVWCYNISVMYSSR